MGSARSIGILTILNIAGAVIAVVNSVVVAQFFGTGRALEIYFAAATLEMMALKLTQTGQLGEIFLPIYHRIKEAGGIKIAQRAFSIIFNWMIIFVFVLAAVLWMLAPVLMKILVPGFGTEGKAVGVVMFRWILPLLGLQVIFSLVQTLANAERWFGKPEAVVVGTQLIRTVSIWLLARPLGVWAMVAAMWVSQGFQLVGYVFMLYKMGYRHSLSLGQEGFGAWSVFRKMFVTFIYVGATQVYGFAFNAGLSLLPQQGTYAVFKYVQQLYTKTYTILLRPVSVVFFTHISEALARGAKNVRALAQQALARCLGIGVLVVVAIIVAGRPLLGGLWGGELFGHENLDLATWLLRLFYLLIFVSALGQIGRKTVMSLGLVKRQYVSITLVQILCAVFAWTLIVPYGAAGALGVVALNAIGLGLAPLVVLLLWRRDLVVFYKLRLLLRWLIAGLTGLAVGQLLIFAVQNRFLISGRISQLVWAVVLAGTTTTVSVAAAWLVNIYEVRESFRRIFAKIRVNTVAIKPMKRKP